MRRHIQYVSSAVFVLLAAAGCRHEELCYDHAHFAETMVLFDWTSCQDADPGYMELYMIKEDGTQPIRYQFPGSKGGLVEVPLGVYGLVGFNGDSEVAAVSGTSSAETFCIRTAGTSLLSLMNVRGEEPPRVKGTEDERVTYAPDRLWSGYLGGVELTTPMGKYTVTIKEHDMLCNYTLTITTVENVKYATSISCSLTGMADGVMAASGLPSSEKATMVAIVGSDKESVITGGFKTFGRAALDEVNHYLTIYAVMVDGKRYYYTFDVTDQVALAQDPRNVHIVLDGIELPKPITNGSGFNPGVSDWGDGGNFEIEM